MPHLPRPNHRPLVTARHAAIRLCLAASLLAGIGCGGKVTPPAEAAHESASAAPAVEGPSQPTVSVLVQRGTAEVAAGNYDRAIQLLTEAIEYPASATAAPLDPTLRTNALHQRGIAYMEKGFPDTALKDFSAVLAEVPKHAEALCRRGAAHLDMNDIYKALDDCTESIRLVPDNPRAYLTRGNAYLRRGAYGRAIADLEEARRLDTSHHLPTQEPLAKAYFRRSDQLQSQDQPGEAASMLSRAVELDPAYSPASHETANHPAPTAEITPTPRTPSADASPQLRAKPILTEDLAQPAEVAVRVRQAEQQLAAGRIAAAINEYSAAVALDRERADLYVARGNLWLRLQFADTALLDAQEAIRLAGDAPAYRLEAEAFLAQGNHYRAISSASEAMRQGPIDLSTIALRGRAYLGREMYDEAIRDLTYASEGDEKLAVQIRPLLAEAHFLRGRALEKQGDPTAAAADLQLAEKLGWSAEEER